MVAPFTTRIPKKFYKTITFDGGSGTGAVGTVAVATLGGRVRITSMSVYCSTNLTSSGGTLSLGMTGNVDGLIESTLASDIDSGEWWQDASPEVGISPAIVNQNVAGNIFLTVGSADVTAGVLVFEFEYVPISPTGGSLT